MRLGEFSHALKIVGASVSWRYNWDFTLSTLKTHILRLQSVPHSEKSEFGTTLQIMIGHIRVKSRDLLFRSVFQSAHL